MTWVRTFAPSSVQWRGPEGVVYLDIVGDLADESIMYRWTTSHGILHRMDGPARIHIYSRRNFYRDFKYLSSFENPRSIDIWLEKFEVDVDLKWSIDGATLHIMDYATLPQPFPDIDGEFIKQKILDGENVGQWISVARYLGVFEEEALRSLELAGWM